VLRAAFLCPCMAWCYNSPCRKDWL